jgi:hypothetical protein
VLIDPTALPTSEREHIGGIELEGQMHQSCRILELNAKCSKLHRGIQGRKQCRIKGDIKATGTTVRTPNE